METSEAVAQQIRDLLQNERLAVLCTQQHGQPYASLVAFAATANLKRIAFCTPETTRKFANLAANPRVAMLVTNSRNQASDVYSAASLTAIGKALPAQQPAQEGAATDLRALYLSKHPHLADFARARTTALVEIRVERYLLVHNFQNVYDFKVES
jgi:nitroimidazol reductase NimA-like FMN-containing flavoprotein (pyridoxamine 5'-phosphate oxidase superfamily)